MGFLHSIADRFDPPREKRAADPSWRALAGGSVDFSDALANADKPAITPRLAETLTTVLACVNAIGGAISSLPAWVFLLKENGREIAKNHPVARLVREGPNQYQSWPDFIHWVSDSFLLQGNALAEIVTDNSGRVIALQPIPWPHVTVVLLPSGRLVYDVAPINLLNGQQGRSRRLLDSEVLHVKDRSDDGYVGRSRLARAGTTVRTGLTQESFGEMLYANRATPSGAFSFKEALRGEQRDYLREHIQDAWAGVKHAGKVLILDSDASFTPITVTPESLEMLATRRFSTEEIARMFGVPPPIVGIWDHSTFTNSETAGRWFAQFTLAPIIRKIEDAFRRSVFSAESRATHEIEFDMTGFLRGDAEARWKAHEIAVKNSILTPNEIREVEGWNPRDDLEQTPRDPTEGIG